MENKLQKINLSKITTIVNSLYFISVVVLVLLSVGALGAPFAGATRNGLEMYFVGGSAIVVILSLVDIFRSGSLKNTSVYIWLSFFLAMCIGFLARPF